MRHEVRRLEALLTMARSYDRTATAEHFRNRRRRRRRHRRSRNWKSHRIWRRRKAFPKGAIATSVLFCFFFTANIRVHARFSPLSNSYLHITIKNRTPINYRVKLAEVLTEWHKSFMMMIFVYIYVFKCVTLSLIFRSFSLMEFKKSLTH